MHRSSDDSDHSPLPGPLRAQPGEVAARRERLGSAGEHELQQACGTHDRANRFYTQQMNDRLNDQMREFIGRMEMMFIATADAHGECDALFRPARPGSPSSWTTAPSPGPSTGNGVMASAGNLLGNPHVGLLFIDFVRDPIGLHVNGSASLLAPATSPSGTRPTRSTSSPGGGPNGGSWSRWRRPTSTAPSTSPAGAPASHAGLGHGRPGEEGRGLLPSGRRPRPPLPRSPERAR